jgi:DNA polymerase-3 subunit delta'
MSLRPVYGHEALLDRLAGAIASGRFPQAALLIGPAGVGKQRLTLWVAQGLLCEAGTGTPCNECHSCRQVVGLQHPDLHWFIPIPRPKASDSEKQVSEADAALAEVIAERRQEPLYGRPDGMHSHSMASIRLLLRKVVMKPFQGQRKVIVVGDAERLTPQKGTDAAANALLKALEEPPEDTVLILTASEPQALLPTIRSRVVPLRVGRVRDADVRDFLVQELELAADDPGLDLRVALAEGRIGRALWVDEDGDAAERAAAALLQQIEQGARGWSRAALAQAHWGARSGFGATLDALAVRLRDRLEAGSQREEDLAEIIEALRRVEQAKDQTRQNVNPQLALAVLGSDLEQLL